MKAMRSLRNLVTGVLVAATTAGCSVLQPHINVPAERLEPGATPAVQLAAQTLRARDLQQLYLDAVSQQSAAVNGLAMALIPLSVGSLAVGIANPGASFTRNFLLGAGAGAATAYGLGTLFIDRKRDAIYYAGAKSLYCLQVVIAPVEVTDADLTQMGRDVDNLRLRLGIAAAAGVDGKLLEQANIMFVAGRALVTDIRNAPVRFSNEIDNINIAVNAEINKTEPDLTKIIDTVANLQKYATGIIPNFPAAKPAVAGETQSLRLARTAGDAAASLRQSIAEVSAWVAAYQGAITATAAKMTAEKCTLISPSAAASPTIVVMGNQPVTVHNGSGGTPMVITPQPMIPPPPRIAGPPSPPIVNNPNDPLVDLTDNGPNSLFAKLRERFKLSEQRTKFPRSDSFVVVVKRFQHCINETENGRLSASQVNKVIAAPDPTVCPPAPGGAAPLGGAAPTAGAAPAGAAAPAGGAPSAGAARPAGGAAPAGGAPAAGAAPGAPVPLLPGSPNLGNR